jgi:hypothetical protein
LVAMFDPAMDGWKSTGFGMAANRPFTAVGCEAGRIYLYDMLHELSVSEDGGATWEGIATVTPPDGASPFDDIQVEGARILLRFKRPYGVSEDAGSIDGGKTWKRFPPGAGVQLKAGCFHWIENGFVSSDCAPGGADRKDAAPFAKLERLFIQEGGGLFALADSGLFHFSPPETGIETAAAWQGVGAAADWTGWILAGGVFSRQTADKVTWVSTGAPVTTGIMRAMRPSARAGAASGLRMRPIFFGGGKGFLADGRFSGFIATGR